IFNQQFQKFKQYHTTLKTISLYIENNITLYTKQYHKCQIS
ncbi:hypothetical protein KSS87_004316, partial [Heliosperma pusillum]